jgi:PHD/YefM family antitoxin component YafN of YafNO toxin-antitoxin module
MVKTINLKKTTKSELIELIRKLKRRKDDQYFLQENGKAMAVLISQAEYEKYREEQRLKAVERLQKLMSEVHAQIPQDMSEDEVEREVNEAIHEMRGIKC